jgi:hypothetical protein
MSQNIIPQELEDEITGKITSVSIPHSELALAQTLSDDWSNFSEAICLIDRNAGVVTSEFKTYGSVIALYERILDRLGIPVEDSHLESSKEAVVSDLQKRYGARTEA